MNVILVAVDGSEPSQRAFSLATDVARRFGAKLRVAYVVSPMVLPPEALGLTPDKVAAEHRRFAEELVREATAPAVAAGVSVEPLILHGNPAEQIAQAALATDVDLVVVGTSGRAALARVILGSTTDRLVHVSHKPVLVVP